MSTPHLESSAAVSPTTNATAGDATTDDSPWPSAPPWSLPQAFVHIPPLVPNRLARGVHQAALAVIDVIKRAEKLAIADFRSHLVDTSVGPVRVLEKGTPHPEYASWVFIHGYAAQAVDWRPVLHRLRGHCQHMIAIDMPGHGRSPIPAGGITEATLLLALRDVTEARVGKAPAVVVGNSTGGLGAIRLAQVLGKERVHGLILISPLGGPMTDAEIDTVLQGFNITGVRTGMEFVDRLYNNGTHLRLVQALGAWAHLNRPHLRAMMTQLRSVGFLRPEELRDLPDTLVVWGDGDRILPASGRNFFTEALPEAEHHHPADFGHAPYLDRADALNHLMTAWASKHPGFLCR